MSLNAATIEILIAKGLSAADLLEVARATEKKADPTNAARQARHRARKSNAVTVTPAPPNDNTLTPTPSSETKVSSEGVPPRKFKIPADWVPPPIAELSPKARACAAQWSRESYETVGEAFLLYWRERGTCRAGWTPTFSAWVIRDHSKVMRDERFGNGPPRGARAEKIWQPGERESLAALEVARTGLSLNEFEQARNEHFRKFGGGPAPPDRRGGVVSLGQAARRATG